MTPSLPPATPPAVPDWVGELVDKYRHRLRSFLAYTWELTRAPHAFMAAWASGARDALDPARFLALGLLLSTPLRLLAHRVLWGPTPEVGGLERLVQSSSYQLLYLLIALLAHPVLRLLGSAAPLRATLAAVFFAGAGPGMLLELVGWAASLALWPVLGEAQLMADSVAAYRAQGLEPPPGMTLFSPSTRFPYAVMAMSLVSFLHVERALAGVHRLRAWRTWASLASVFGLMCVVQLAVVVAHAVLARR